MAAPVIVRDADVDDDGTNTTGTVRNNAWKTAIYNRIDAVIAALFALSPGPVPQTTTLTGAQADFALSTNASVLRLNNATDLTLSGFAAGVDGQVVRLVSIGAGNVYLKHQNTGSVAANRLINVATSGDTPLAAGVGTAVIAYDATTARWRLVTHEQGAWITPAYAAGSYTANGAMTWTVDAGDVSILRSYLRGRSLTIAVVLLTTTVGGTPNTALRFAIPGGFTAFAATPYTPCRVFDNGGAAITGWLLANGANIEVYKTLDFGTNWTAATNATAVEGSLIVEVQ